MKGIAKILVPVGAALTALWLGNSSAFVTPSAGQHPKLIAHRGVHQVYTGNDRGMNACHAQPIAPPTHRLIENTIPSMRAAFESGAQVVELDVHLTADGIFAVFHDWRLDCQTNGSGVTHKQRFDTLQALDVGYGYSPDGIHFPLRGAGLGLMPSLREVLEAQLGGQYLINFKSRRAEEGAHLAATLTDPKL